MPTQEDLKLLQALPLDVKIMKTQQRIREWVQYWGEQEVCVSFSGGKDSTVLLHLVRELYPNIKAVFVDTGLEYPEIKSFVKTFDNVEIIRPKLNFRQVIEKYGYPIISKEVAEKIEEAKKCQKSNYTKCISAFNKFRGKIINPNTGGKSIYDLTKYKNLLNLLFNVSAKCCYYLKKKPAETFSHPFIATLAQDSLLRRQAWLKTGCNSFAGKARSKPLSFWTEQDIMHYIDNNIIKIASIYGQIIPDNPLLGQLSFDNKLVNLKCSGCQHTGCMFCLFGAHLDKGETRFQRLHRTHPRIYDYIMGGGEFDSNGLWKPNNKGLGFKFVMDEVNRLLDKEFYRY